MMRVSGVLSAVDLLILMEQAGAVAVAVIMVLVMGIEELVITITTNSKPHVAKVDVAKMDAVLMVVVKMGIVSMGAVNKEVVVI